MRDQEYIERFPLTSHPYVPLFKDLDEKAASEREKMRNLIEGLKARPMRTEKKADSEEDEFFAPVVKPTKSGVSAMKPKEPPKQPPKRKRTTPGLNEEGPSHEASGADAEKGGEVTLLGSPALGTKQRQRNSIIFDDDFSFAQYDSEEERMEQRREKQWSQLPTVALNKQSRSYTGQTICALTAGTQAQGLDGRALNRSERRALLKQQGIVGEKASKANRQWSSSYTERRRSVDTNPRSPRKKVRYKAVQYETPLAAVQTGEVQQFRGTRTVFEDSD
eukprot:GHVN01073161.1.p1 GENE.GHVN01073161.1~~GHVN01073161.1.p1  ORF type:complete len:277 (+),score=44.42 GHVN01073161.1:1098-1928(+)